MGIVVKRAIQVTVIVTEKFKARRIAELRAMIARLERDDREIQMRVQESRDCGVTGSEESRRTQQLDALIERNRNTRSAAAAELELVSGLESGTEYNHGVLEGFVEIEVGDDFGRLVDCRIVVKDDKVVEIGDGRCQGATRKS